MTGSNSLHIQNEKGTHSTSCASNYPFDDTIYHLPSCVDITSVIQIYNEINKVIENNKDLTFNASNVDRITTPGLQLLLSTAISIKAKGGIFIISWPSESFKKMVLDLGFSNQLKEWTGSDV
jgi:anti-anti-sigma regulatory factor